MASVTKPMLQWDWLHIYRVIDKGWHANDPTACLWFASLPNGRYIAFDEELWVEEPVSSVARDIKKRSDGMRVITTFGDPTMWDGEKEMGHSIADEYENRGIPMTKAKNDRTAAGFAIQEALNTRLTDGLPKLLLYEGPNGEGVPTLIKSLRSMRVDKKRPGRIADSKVDHLPICCGYFCMAGVPPSMPPRTGALKKWQMPKTAPRRILGADLTRRRFR